MYRQNLGQKVFNIFNMTFMICFCIIILYPYLNVLAVALNNNAISTYSGLMLIPKIPTLMNFRALFSDNNILRSILVTVFRIIIGVSLSITVEFSASYALSRKRLLGKRSLSLFFLIPTYISGGLIPLYILYSKVHLMNNPLVYVLPGAFMFFDFILFRTFMGTIPDSLEESAKLDGANALVIMTKIYFPLCAPIIATIVLYQAVAHWNDWTTTLYFINSQKWNTLQFELQRTLREQSRLSQLVQTAIMEGQMPVQTPYTSTGVRNAQIIISTLPIIMIYPFLQKYFIKGMLIGGVKE